MRARNLHLSPWPWSGLLALLMAVPAAAAPDQNERLDLAAAEAGPAEVRPGPVRDYSAASRERRLAEKGMAAGSPVMIRIFKAEFELELWMEKGGRFELFATYPICFWSGRLGPKLREGDRQAPEGLYTVGVEQLHRKGRHPRSLNLGFPNEFDRAYSRTGSYILVHGGCRSIGCYAMTDPVMEEIYSLSESALSAGQERIQVHAFPFRMTEENLALHKRNVWHSFWLNLKDAYDAFEHARLPPRISVCGRRYVVSEGSPSSAVAGDHGLACNSSDMVASHSGETNNELQQVAEAEAEAVARRHSRSAGRGRGARAAYAAARRARSRTSSLARAKRAAR